MFDSGTLGIPSSGEFTKSCDHARKIMNVEKMRRVIKLQKKILNIWLWLALDGIGKMHYKHIGD